MEEAHAAGILHRDSKPQNVFLTTAPTGEPSVKILDFGVSKILDSKLRVTASSTTQSGALIGTPLYMSPERLKSPGEAEPRADVLAAYGVPNGIVETGLAVGAVDVLVLPQSTETLLFALRKAARAATGTATGKVVTVFSPKGGSGKTMLATNLAVATARSGMRTLLVDLDLQFGDSALTLAVTPRAQRSGDLAASAGDIDSDKLAAFVSIDPRSELAVLPAPRRPEEADIVGQTVLAAVLDAARNAYEAIVIDTGPLFDAAMLAALDQTDRLLLLYSRSRR